MNEPIWMIRLGKLIFTLILIYVLFRLVRYLFNLIENDPSKKPLNPVGIVKHDIWFAGLGYILLTAVFFYPALLTINTHLIGPLEDNMQNYWNLWYAYNKVWHGTENLGFNRYIFYPDGGITSYHTWSFYNLAISIPLRTVLDPITTYNLIILHAFPLAGIGAFLFVRYLVGDSLLAFIGGFIFAFSPFHFARAQHHLNINSIQFIPFFALFFIKSIRGNSLKNLALASIFLILNALCDWYFLIHAWFFMVFSYIYLAVRRRKIVLGNVLWKSAVITGSAAILLLPLMWPMIALKFKYVEGTGIAEWGRPFFNVSGYDFFVADMAGFIVPDSYHWLSHFTPFVRRLNGLYTGNEWEKVVYLGFAGIVICLVAGRRFLPRAAKYVLGALSFLIFALGASPHVFGHRLPIFLPYRAIQDIPFLSEARVPVRMIVYVYLFWGVIVALAVSHLIPGRTTPERKSLIAFCLFAFIFVDYYSTKLDKTAINAPSWASAVSPAGKQFGLLNLPIGGPDRSFHKMFYMLEQTFHDIPIVQGMVSRVIGNSLQDRLEIHDLERQQQELIQNRVKYIVIHKQFLVGDPPINLDGYRKTYKLVFEDHQAVVFQVY